MVQTAPIRRSVTSLHGKTTCADLFWKHGACFQSSINRNYQILIGIIECCWPTNNATLLVGQQVATNTTGKTQISTEAWSYNHMSIEKNSRMHNGTESKVDSVWRTFFQMVDPVSEALARNNQISVCRQTTIKNLFEMTSPTFPAWSKTPITWLTVVLVTRWSIRHPPWKYAFYRKNALADFHQQRVSTPTLKPVAHTSTNVEVPASTATLFFCTLAHSESSWEILTLKVGR